MKKAIILSAALLLIILSACGKAPQAKSDFSVAFTAEHQDDDTKYTGTLTKSGDRIHITLSEPYTIKGMTFDYQDSELSIERNGHNAITNCRYLPADSLPSTLHNILAELTHAAYTKSENGEDLYTIPTPYGEAELSASDGIPTALTAPESRWKFLFHES